MNDRELLEMAAKAAGIPEPWSHDRMAAFQYCALYWNPLEDSGDAFELMGKLKLNIKQGKFSVSVNNKDGIYQTMRVRNEEERGSVTRLVVVMAAAEIGKSMP